MSHMTMEKKTVMKMVNERVMLPIRAIAESAGCDVDWIGETKTDAVAK